LAAEYTGSGLATEYTDGRVATECTEYICDRPPDFMAGSGMSVTTMILIAVAAVAPVLSADRHESVRLYVYTAASASGEHTEEEKGRLEAVEELRGALKKKKGLSIVDDRSQADVIVEVLEREQRDAPLGGFGGKTITAMGDTIIRVHLIAGDEQADLKGIGQGTWGRAAKDAAERITKWIARWETKKSPKSATSVSKPRQ
jgi:hypothetical protein